MAASIQRIRSAVIDGRAQNPRYVQKQLAVLHDLLVSNADALKDAIKADTHTTAAEAEVEFCFAVDAVKKQYSQFDFSEEIKHEYAIARSENAPNRKIAAGVVYIVPTKHTMLYSVVAPITAAITAGNCVVLELEVTTRRTAAVLRSILPQKLDHDTFAVVDTRPSEDFLRGCVVVNQVDDSAIGSARNLTSPSTSRVIAVVDRAADIDEAAKTLVRARTAFGGGSPYAPDLVLVNEWVMEQFANAAVSYFSKYLSAAVAGTGGYTSERSNGSAVKSGGIATRKQRESALTEKELSETGVTVLLSGDRGSIVSISNRESSILSKKITTPTLIIHPITSLDDAIDFGNDSTTPLLAAYHFATPAFAKYTTQFLSANSHFVNHIPLPLLLGPAASTSYPLSAESRYTLAMFTNPCPIYISDSTTSTQSKSALQATASNALEVGGNASTAIAQLRQAAAEPLKPTGQRDGKVVGFFDQGLMVGAGVVLTPVIVGLGVATYYGARAAMRRWR